MPFSGVARNTRPHGRGTDGTARSSRRSVLRTAAGAGAALLGGATATGTASAGDLGGDNGDYPTPEGVPVITTRGQFDDDGDMVAGVTPTEYAGGGDWAEWDRTAPGGEEIVVVVHGWNIEEPGGKDVANTTRIALRNSGYDQFVVGYTWDSDEGDGLIDQGWNEGVEIARKNGPKLAQWIADWNDNGGRPIRVIGHSLGARVVVEALTDLRARGRWNALRSVTLLGGAIDDQEVETDEPYGDDIEYATRRCDNFYKTDDAVLDWAYGAIEFDTAVGEEGVQDASDSPGNYAEADVTDQVADHNSYYQPAEGCIPTVVETF